MNEQKAFQDNFLSILKKTQMAISIFLNNGIKLEGSIEDYDHEVVFLKGYATQMIYKRSIATIVPREFQTAQLAEQQS